MRMSVRKLIMKQFHNWGAGRLSLVALCGFSVFAASTSTAYILTRSSDPNLKFPNENERKEIFQKIALGYDSLVGMDEKGSGVLNLRRQLIPKASGDVLEVAAGTGRNMEFYDSANVQSLTLIDFSREMLTQALAKKKLAEPIPVRFKVGNAAKLDFPDAQFDTIVDSFGICSFEKPVDTLKELKRVLKPGGKILLLEHGVAKWNFITRFLDSTVKNNVHKYGCYHNRDILQIIQDAGLDVVEIERKHWGSTYSIIACPSSKKSSSAVTIKNSNIIVDENQEILQKRAVITDEPEVEEKHTDDRAFANSVVEVNEIPRELSAEARALFDAE